MGRRAAAPPGVHATPTSRGQAETPPPRLWEEGDVSYKAWSHIHAGQTLSLYVFFLPPMSSIEQNPWTTEPTRKDVTPSARPPGHACTGQSGRSYSILDPRSLEDGKQTCLLMVTKATRKPSPALVSRPHPRDPGWKEAERAERPRTELPWTWAPSPVSLAGR